MIDEALTDPFGWLFDISVDKLSSEDQYQSLKAKLLRDGLLSFPLVMDNI